jgi:hypothetical protein
LFFVPLFYYLIITMKEKLAGGRIADSTVDSPATDNSGKDA